MSGDPRKLVKFVCTSKAHAKAHRDAALTIHDGAWAFCPAGSEAKAHEWAPSEGLPIADAMRFTPRQQAPTAVPDETAPPPPAKPATARGKARTG